MTARGGGEQSALKLLAPSVSAAVDRKGYPDLADQALACGRGVYARVSDIQGGRAEIVALIAEAVYRAAAAERDAIAGREALAARLAIEGAADVVKIALSRLAESHR